MNATDSSDSGGSMRLLTLCGNLSFYLVAIGGNACVLLTFLKYSALRSKDCLYLIASLAFCDMLTGLASLPFVCGVILDHIGWLPSPFTTLECLVVGFTQNYPILAGQMMTMFIAYDRFLAFWNQMNYRNKDHKKYALRALAFSHVFAACYMGYVFVGVGDLDARLPFCSLTIIWTETMFYMYVVYFAAVGCAVLLFYLLALVLMHHATQMKIDEANPTQTAPSTTKNQNQNQNQVKRSNKNRETTFQRQVRVTRTINTVLFFYTFLWLAPMGTILAGSFLGAPEWFLLVMEPIVDMGLSMNISINVFIYAAKHKVMRMFLAGFFQCKRANQIQV